MPRPKNYKCAACSRISDEEAKQRECWQGQLCHSRRSYYRHRQKRNSDRKLKYRLKQNSAPSVSVEQPQKIVIAPPIVTKPLAVAFIYSPSTGGAHSIGFQVYQDATLIATVEAVHCTGWSNLDLAAHITNVIGDLNKRFGITSLADRRVLLAKECPIPGCPLHT